jgi:hypothetical protein
MGTKNDPKPGDCYLKALPDEPMFVLLARDPGAPTLVKSWCDQRAARIHTGDLPDSDMEVVSEASKCATDMEQWRSRNLTAGAGGVPTWKAQPVRSSYDYDARQILIAGLKAQGELPATAEALDEDCGLDPDLQLAVDTIAVVLMRADGCCPPHCCCCSPGGKCCDCGATVS